MSWRNVFAGEIVDDRAIRSIVAMAPLDEMLQRCLHPLKFGNLAFDVAYPVYRQRLDIGTSAAAIPIEIE